MGYALSPTLTVFHAGDEIASFRLDRTSAGRIINDLESNERCLSLPNFEYHVDATLRPFMGLRNRDLPDPPDGPKWQHAPEPQFPGKEAKIRAAVAGTDLAGVATPAQAQAFFRMLEDWGSRLSPDDWREHFRKEYLMTVADRADFAEHRLANDFPCDQSMLALLDQYNLYEHLDLDAYADSFDEDLVHFVEAGGMVHVFWAT